MRIRSVEAVPLLANFKRTLSFGLSDRKASSNVLVRIVTDEGVVGYGEACPVPAFTAETQVSVVRNIETVVRPLLIGRSAFDREPAIRDLERVLRHCPFTLAGVDLALWDIAGKLTGQSASRLLGGRYRDSVDVHGSVGWATQDEMVATAIDQLNSGVRSLKAYVGRGELGDDLRCLEAIRLAVPDEVRLLVDVNGLWTTSQCLRALPRLEAIGVMVLEQPLAAENTAGQAEVLTRTSIEIAADESVYLASDVAAIGMGRRARLINLGVSKLGGLVRARECQATAQSVGLGVLVGSVLELGVANAAGLHLAAAVERLDYPCYTVGPLKYERDIVSESITLNAGQIRVPEGPGLGVEVDEDAVSHMDARKV